MSLLPEETPQSAAKRADLYLGWPNAGQTSLLLGIDQAEIDSRRRSRALLAVWIHELGEYRFPMFQFYRGGTFEQMPSLLALLPDPSSSGWGWVEWFVSHRTLLNGGCPADYLLVGRFEEVLKVADIEASDSEPW